MGDLYKMTWRARAYLAIPVALYCILLGLACLLTPERFNSVSFEVLKQRMPCGLEGWGWLHLSVGALGAYAAVRGREGPARLALILVAMVLAPWVHGFVVAFLTERTASPTGAITYGVLLSTHLIQLRDPLRTPFEVLLKAVRNERK